RARHDRQTRGRMNVVAKYPMLRRQSRRKRRRPYNPTSLRLRELERLIAARHGRSLDTDDADLYLIPVAQTIRRMRIGAAPEDIRNHFQRWADRFAPHVSKDVLDDAADEALQESYPWTHKADALARHLRVTNAEREVLDLRTIGACDLSKSERA